MARFTIAFGLALCASSVLILLLTPTSRITTEFIPMIFGMPIFICGVFSLNPHRRRVWLRVAIFVAALGASGALTRLVVLGLRRMDGEPIYAVPTWIAASLAVALTLYALIAVRFVRRTRGPNGRAKVV